MDYKYGNLEQGANTAGIQVILSKSKTISILVTWGLVRAVLALAEPSLHILRNKGIISTNMFNDFKGLQRGFPEFKAKFHGVALLDCVQEQTTLYMHILHQAWNKHFLPWGRVIFG